LSLSLIQYFSPQPPECDRPVRLRNPVENDPHPLAILASQQLMQRLQMNVQLSGPLFNPGDGKMFGVLVVEDVTGKAGYVSAFSGMLNQQWLVDGFVPPVFDMQAQKTFLNAGESELLTFTAKIEKSRRSVERIIAGRQLEDLERQGETALAQLRALHKRNKTARHLLRERCRTDSLGARLLLRLSLLSQRDKRAYKNASLCWAKKIQQAELRIREDFDAPLEQLIEQRRNFSVKLHRQVFETYQLHNFRAESVTLNELFDGKMPPGGTGDCAAPKLLQFAIRHHLKPLALAEFWWGAEPTQAVRHHAHYYPPCRGKCEPILPFMLKGVEMEARAGDLDSRALVPDIVYEDESLLIVEKPAGLLSVPGKEQQHSVYSWLQENNAGAESVLLVHRLDMATSGLLLAAKNAAVYKNLQRQFLHRTVKKRYVAVLSRAIDIQSRCIDLPLRVDLDDRPRQMVCQEHGKPAITHVRVISCDAQTSRVYFYPLTGRTHQLRVHAAHCLGLSAPIVGDRLYGTDAERLFLHAEKISFKHPQSGKIMEVLSDVPF
jgi:tRNA pseudouridine32 synthase/23S rRNA pseudouridine746 synthase